MATYAWGFRHAVNETRVYPVTFASDLLTGASITTASVVHTPPSGSPTVPTATVATPIVYVTFAPGSVAGSHRLRISANVTNVGLPAETLIVTMDVQVDA